MRFIAAATAVVMSQIAFAQDTTATGRADTSAFHRTLTTATVTGVRPFLQTRAGKIVLNVAESPLAAGGNASEMISHIPGVDGLQYHGRPLLVLVDGRSNGLKGDDLRTLLDGMPAGTIDRIELIENPSAKFDASGGAVLNIITLKSRKTGLNGTVSSGVGSGRYFKFNEGGTLNYRAGKLNAYAGYDLVHGKPYYDYYSNRALDSARSITETTRGTRKSDNHSFRAGMDYNFDWRNSFGIQFKGQYNLRQHRSDNLSLLGDSSSTVQTLGRTRYFIPSANVWYTHHFDSAGRELSFNADYLQYNKYWDEDLVTKYFDTKGHATADATVLTDHSPAHNTIFSLSADYIHPTNTGKIEMGFKSSFTRTDNDVLWQTLASGRWIVDQGLSNHFIYQENINAGYINYSRRWAKLGLDLGLRAEQTRSEGRSITLDQTDRKSYLSAFPNVGLQYTLPHEQELSFAYRRGIERFGFDVVNPFVRYISQYSYSKGNPSIRPSSSQNFSLSYSLRGELTASASFQHFLDAPGTRYYKADSGNAVISTETNLGSADQFETDLSWTKGFFNGKWTCSNSLGGMYAKYNMKGAGADNGLNGGGANDGQNGGERYAQGGRWTAMLSTDHVVLVGKGWKIQFDAMYYSPFLLGVYSFRSRFIADFGVSKTVLHEKGRFSLNMSDIFNTYVNRFTIQSDGIVSTNRQKTETQALKLVFTYKFGGKAGKNAAGHISGIEELKQRLGGN